MKQKTDILHVGSKILKPIMIKNGFSFSVDGEGESSGGNFAYGSWRKSDRKLEYHFRFSLGLVEYSLGTSTIEHEFFMWALTGEKHKAKYPGSSKDPFDGFRRLLDDLKNYGTVFLNGSDLDLRKDIRKAAQLKGYWESLSPLKRMEIK